MGSAPRRGDGGHLGRHTERAQLSEQLGEARVDLGVCQVLECHHDLADGGADPEDGHLSAVRASGVPPADPLDGHVFSLHSRGTASLQTHKLFEAPHYGLIAHVEAVLRGEEKNAVSGREGVETERILDLVRACTR